MRRRVYLPPRVPGGIRFGGDPMGLLFVIGIIVVALLGLAESRLFLALALLLGVPIGIILRLTSRD